MHDVESQGGRNGGGEGGGGVEDIEGIGNRKAKFWAIAVLEMTPRWSRC